MKIAVCIKQGVEITNHFSLSDGNIDFQHSTLTLNPWDEFAIEAALQITETYGGEVTAISAGTMAVQKGLRHALAMGCQQAIHILEDNPEQIPSLERSKILSKAIQKLGKTDLILFGKQSADYEYGILAAQFAQVHQTLFIPLVSSIESFDSEKNQLTLTHQPHLEKQQVAAPLPLVISINKNFAEPRFPSFMGTRKAKNADIPQWAHAELGLPETIAESSSLELIPDSQKVFTWIKGSDPEMTAIEVKTILQKERLI